MFLCLCFIERVCNLWLFNIILYWSFNKTLKFGCSQGIGKSGNRRRRLLLSDPSVRDGEIVFGVAHIFASFNDTFIVSTVPFSPIFKVCCGQFTYCCDVYVSACDWFVWERNPCSHYWYDVMILGSILLFFQKI